MAYPAWSADGAVGIAGGYDNVDIAYPATDANDLMVMVLIHYRYLGNTPATTITTPSGWTEAATGSWSYLRYSVYVKLATGSESGTINVQAAHGGVPFMGKISAYSGVDTSTPYEAAAASSSVSDDEWAIASITTTVNECLVIAALFCNDDCAADDDGGSFSERWDETTIVGGDVAIHLYEYQDALSGASPTDTITSSANIGKVCGVATANIAKVDGS
jgi:hypothetical protein